MNDSSQMRFPRDNTGLDTIIHGSSKILFDERYRWKFLESVFWRKVHKRNILALKCLRSPRLQERLQKHPGQWEEALYSSVTCASWNADLWKRGEACIRTGSEKRPVSTAGAVSGLPFTSSPILSLLRPEAPGFRLLAYFLSPVNTDFNTDVPVNLLNSSSN